MTKTKEVLTMKDKIWQALIKKYKDEDGIRGLFVKLFADCILMAIAIVAVSIFRVYFY